MLGKVYQPPSWRANSVRKFLAYLSVDGNSTSEPFIGKDHALRKLPKFETKHLLYLQTQIFSFCKFWNDTFYFWNAQLSEAV